MTLAPRPPNERLDRLSALLQAIAPRVIASGSIPSQEPSLDLYILANARTEPTHVGLGPREKSPAEAVAVITVAMDGPAAPLLIHELRQPQAAELAKTDRGAVQAAHLLLTELAAPRCGHQAMRASTAMVLFIGVLRHLVADPQRNHGLFTGLHDRRLAMALVAMHERPDLGWTLERLAEHAGMSRTVFATQFRATLGTPPGRYLAQLRLQIARSAVESGQGLKAAARAAGYSNTSALSRALGRMHACPSAGT